MLPLLGGSSHLVPFSKCLVTPIYGTSLGHLEGMTIDVQGIIGQAKFRPVVKWSGPRSLRRSSLPPFFGRINITNLPNLPPIACQSLSFGLSQSMALSPSPHLGILGSKKNLAGCSDSDDARLASCAFLSRDIYLRGSGLLLNAVDSTCGLSDWCLNSKDPWDGSSVFPYQLPSNINLLG